MYGSVRCLSIACHSWPPPTSLNSICVRVCVGGLCLCRVGKGAGDVGLGCSHVRLCEFALLFPSDAPAKPPFFTTGVSCWLKNPGGDSAQFARGGEGALLMVCSSHCFIDCRCSLDSRRTSVVRIEWWGSSKEASSDAAYFVSSP